MNAAKAGAALSPAGRVARDHDPDRFLASLFAPASRREALFLLIAFNHELVRVLEVAPAREGAPPIAALIRLQWWREVVEGAARRHELAEPLGRALREGALDRRCLLDIIEAREAEAEGIETLDAWRAVQLGGAGGVQEATARLLGVRDADALTRLRASGAAYAAGAMLRSMGPIERSGRSVLPRTVREAAEGGADAVLRAEGMRWMGQAGRPPLARSQVAARLAGVLARRDLRRGPGAGPRGLPDRAALLAAWLRG